MKLLDELPPGAAHLERLRKTPPRLPFFLLGELEPASAADLIERLRDVGIEARVERRASLAPREVRRKVFKLWRGYGWVSVALGGMIRVPVAASRASHGLFLLSTLLPFAVGPLSALGWLLVAERRPRAKLTPTANEANPTVNLARCLSELGRREDRRLVARLLDRLQVTRDLGAAEVAAALGARATLACRGLVALDDARRGLDEDDLRRQAAAEHAGNDSGGALDRLREGERRRGVLIADLLRVLSRLDLVCLRLARAGGLDARREMDALKQDVADLTLELEAERDVAALLEGKP